MWPSELGNLAGCAFRQSYVRIFFGMVLFNCLRKSEKPSSLYSEPIKQTLRISFGCVTICNFHVWNTARIARNTSSFLLLSNIWQKAYPFTAYTSIQCVCWRWRRLNKDLEPQINVVFPHWYLVAVTLPTLSQFFILSLDLNWKWFNLS